MSLTYRFATPNDSLQLAEISILAAGGTFELLLKGLKRGVDVKAVLAELAKSDKTEYSYRFFRVAELDGQVVGGINLVSKKERVALAANINPILQQKFGFGIVQLVKFYLRARHLKGMNILKVPENSLHINDIGILPNNQGMGIGGELIDYAKQTAKERGYDYLTLYVWKDNESAIKFYTKHGFTYVKEAQVRRHKYLPHDASILMWIKIDH